MARTAEEPESSLKSDGAAETSTAAGGRQQLPARLSDETLRETGPNEPHEKAGTESSQQQEEQGHAAQHRDSVVWNLDDKHAARARETVANTREPPTSRLPDETLSQDDVAADSISSGEEQGG